MPHGRTAPDSGTPPTPHYCTTPPDPHGARRGCPSWPACLRPGWLEGDADDEENTLGADLAALACLAAGALLFLIVAAVLLPLFI